jgi:hypothetical protein
MSSNLRSPDVDYESCDNRKQIPIGRRAVLHQGLINGVQPVKTDIGVHLNTRLTHAFCTLFNYLTRDTKVVDV